MTPHAALIDPTSAGVREAPLLRRAGLLIDLFGRAVRATRAWETGARNPRAAATRAFHELVD